MFARFIDDDTPAVVRQNFDALVWARLVSNACYRFSPPFIAVIARGLDVSVGTLGVGLMVAEFSGLLSPLVGRRIDRANRVVSMAIGMSLLSLGLIVAASSTNVAAFAAGIFLVGIAKIVFDTGLIVWVNDHVPYERRGRLVGVIETSWALGLFIGVSLMGVVTTVLSWRWGLVTGAVAMAAACAVVSARLPRREAHAPPRSSSSPTLPRGGLLVVASMFTLMAGSQCLGITFGPWFEDEFGFNGTALVCVVIAIGVIELVASSTSSRVMDVWGKDICVQRGALIMVGTACIMAVASSAPAASVPALVLYMLGFEFAVVSILPIAANIVPGASGAGLGLAVGAGTSGRAVFSAVATALYESVGPIGPAVAGALLAGTTAVLIGLYARNPGTRS